jgi:hypothetical protein
MNPVHSKKDRDAFLRALMLWDRPHHELGGKPLALDDDTDAWIETAFSIRVGGVIKD